MATRLVLLFVIVAFSYPNNFPAMPVNRTDQPAARCAPGHNAARIGFSTWPADTLVHIYLRTPDFSENDVEAVRVAARNWDNSAADNGSNVHFRVFGLVNEASTAAGDLTLIRGNVYDKKSKHLALLVVYGGVHIELIDYALIIVDFNATNRDVLINVMAHELGHSLGLLDCHTCLRTTTAMGFLKGADESNGIEGPTPCDNVQVMEAYRKLRSDVQPAIGAN